MGIGPLPYAPPICADETLWSWVTRVAQYHGWSADEFLGLLGHDRAPWEDYFRQVDVDCIPPEELLDTLAEITGFPRERLSSHRVPPSPSTLWLDDRVAFCESCWAQTNAVPYVRRAWLDAWCIECPVHACALVTIAKVHRPRRGADWNAAWASRFDWAQRTNALWTPATSELLGRGSTVILRPPRVGSGGLSDPSSADGTERKAASMRPNARLTSAGATVASIDALATNPTPDVFEKELVLLAGRPWREFSLVRAFFDLHERIVWRNTPEGYDPEYPLTEPLGSLTLRSGAMRIGRALVDILFDQPYREPRIANPLRRWIGALYGKPRMYLLRELAGWPVPLRERWKRQFEWTDEYEWRRQVTQRAVTSGGLSR
jgi:TniQ